MRLVELCGPSGVGKSTTYRTLLEAGGFIPNPKPGEDVAKRLQREGCAEFADVREFCALLDRVFETATGPMQRVRRAHCRRSLSKAIMCRQGGAGTMVVDGGLVQRGQGVDRLLSAVPLEDYYRAMPLPDLTVMFSAPQAVIEERNRGRGGDHDRSADAARSIEVYAIAKRIIEERGGAVRIVDTMRSPRANAATILGWLKDDGRAGVSEALAVA